MRYEVNVVVDVKADEGVVHHSVKSVVQHLVTYRG